MRMVRIMYEPKKWVTCDDVTQRAAGVVQEALRERLSAVEHFLEPASPDEAHDPEHVHQLRVATRRAGAALAVCADFLPRRKSKRMRRSLKRIRQAAGIARDQDVMAQRYSLPREDLAAQAQDWLWARIVDARRAAIPAVDENYRRYADEKFAKRAEKLVAGARWRGDGEEPSFAALAQVQLAAAAEGFFEVARRRPRRAAAMHKLRIAGKRFRYSIELFAAVSETLRDEIYPIVEQAQELLGKANDHAVAAERIAEWAKHKGAGSAPPEGVDKIVKREKKKAAAARQAFLQWLTAERVRSLETQFHEAIKASRQSSARPADEDL